MTPKSEDDGPCGCADGWVEVGPSYARRLHPDPPQLALDATDADVRAREVLVERVEVLRRSAEGSLYPCRVHRPEAFKRWVQRNYNPRDVRAGGAG